jgi:DNA replication and repair protein RecF
MRSFRGYADADEALGPGIVILTGANASGKTSLLEAVLYAACGRSFRTSRESEMIRSGEAGFAVEIELTGGGTVRRRRVSYERGGGASVTGAGTAGDTDARWLASGSILSFSPDDLELVKGSPSVRRRFLDECLTAAGSAYARLIHDYQRVHLQRNAFLKRVRAGRAPIADIAPWDRQMARLSLEIYRQRQSMCLKLSPLFEQALEAITGAAAPASLAYRSQLEAFAGEPDPGQAVIDAMAEKWPHDIERVSTSLGIHRDDIDFVIGGRNMRPFGSQGEQRSAVLAVLVARWRIASEGSGEPPVLLLDDVMSELDPDRRRRLMLLLSPDDGNTAGQIFITAADPGLFSREELSSAQAFWLEGGRIHRAGEGATEAPAAGDAHESITSEGDAGG